MKTITPTTAQLRMLASIKAQQWMIKPDAVPDYALSALEAFEHSEKERGENYLEQFYTLRKPSFMDGDGIAHIEVRGALLDKCPPILETVGLATRYPTIIAEAKASIEQGAKAILYYVDSPGGTVSGVIEGGEVISDSPIPTAAHCNGLACSAAYWLASGAGAIVASPSALVGNIGAIISWADCDKMWEEMGVTFKALTSEGADLKSTFHLEPDETQLAFLQESIDESGEAFRNHVTLGRMAAGASLDPEVFRAGWYSGVRAGSLGLIDAIGSAEDTRNYLISQMS